MHALAEQTTRLTMNGATDAARAFDDGRVDATIEHVSRLAVGAAISAGEMAWLAGELQASGADAEQRAAAGSAITGMSHAMISATAVVQALADDGGTAEVAGSAEALRRVASQLLELL
jgi:hypothetical protein